MVQELKAVLDYNAENGTFTWKIGINRIRSGEIAGTVSHRGYIVIMFKGKSYFAHRLAWLFTYGDWPLEEIDHRNKIKTDNRINNLRLATHSQNQSNKGVCINSKTRLKGASYSKSSRKWQAQIRVNGKIKALGCFGTPEEAHKAYCIAAKQFHGEYACC